MKEAMEPEPRADDAAPSGEPRVVGPGDGKVVDLGSLGVRFMVWSEDSGGGFSLVEHPIPHEPSPPRFIVTPTRTNTATSWRAAWARNSATRSSLRTRAPSSSSPATSGTPSGTPATDRAAYWRSSPQEDSSTSS